MIIISMLAKITLVFGAGAVIQVALARRASAATRHLVWTLVIAGVLLLPPLAISLPDWSAVEYTQPAGFVPLLGTGSLESPVLTAQTSISAKQSGVERPFMLAAVYLAGVVLLLARVVLQHVWMRRLVHAATPIVEAPWLRLFGECTARIGVRRAVRLLRTNGDTMPAAAGIRHASILLPAVADTWPEERRRAVLLHELAHVERHDCLTQTLAAVACAVYWLHPGIWWIAKRLRAERELACDDRVLSAGEDAREYAGHLLELAASALGHSVVPALAVTMARPLELEGRMLAVLDTARNRAIPALRNRLAGVTILIALTVPVAAATITPRLYVLDTEELRGAMRGRFAQNAAPAARQPLAFDVASIKRTPDDTPPGADFIARPGGTLIARNNPIANFITNAYGVPNYTVIGGPEWMRVDRYNLEAKAEGEPSRAEMMLMLQTLLAERFQLRTHRETRELPAYVLTVARGGARLRPSKDGDCVAQRPDGTPPPLAPGETRRPSCGNNNMNSRANPPNMTWTAVRIDMAGVAGALANFFRRPVVDRTGLTGFFDIRLELPPLQPATLDGGATDAGVSVFTVLQEQLGLRVQEGKGPVDVLVVDRLQRPTEN